MNLSVPPIALLLGMLCLIGCGGNPSKANIELRKELQATQAKNAELERQREADLATIASLKDRQTVVPTLPEDRIARLFTAHGIVFSKLTSADTKLLKVYLTPTDEQGQKIKTAGSLVIEAFDLSRPDNVRVGEWKFTTEEARARWNGEMLLYGYVLECPLTSPVEASNLTVKATFTDELTGRAFSAQRQVAVSR